MKKIAGMVMTLVVMLAGTSLAAEVKSRINPDKVNLGMDVSKFEMGQVWLFKGAIEARHCFFFMDPMLRDEYKDYQIKKCGEEFYMDEDPAKPFDESKLSPAEKPFYAKLKAREAELKAGQVEVKDNAATYKTAALVNRAQFPSLEPAALDRVAQSGFVVVPGNAVQLFHVYEENDYRMAPSYITVDSVLQLYHLYFDFTLRQIEETKLLPAATALTTGMGQKLKARADAEKDPKVKAAFEKAVLYFAVATDLTQGSEPAPPKKGRTEEENVASGPPELINPADFKRPPPAWLDPALKADFTAQRDLILKAAETKKGPALGTVDYTLFKPRGHYTRSAALARYFRVMSWLGQPGFILDDKIVPIESALAVVFELTHNPELMKQYDLIYKPTSFYVGPTDDITPALTRQVADEICGKDADLKAWIAKKEDIRAALIKRDPTRIKPMFDDDRALPQVRFMGMRYVPDSDILQKLVHVRPPPPLRAFPTGLDIFAVMGVPAAIEILKSSETKWPDYWPTVTKLQAQFKDMKPGPGEDLNLYWRWMHLLKTLNQAPPAGAAPFMKTKPYEFKTLNTSLASWTELRHDTILYAKPAGAECGGAETPPRVLGYVEARPDFYRELLELQKSTTSELTKQGLLTDQLTEMGKRMEELFGFLIQVSDKEVAGKPLTNEEYDDIRAFGSRLEYMTTGILVDREGATWADVSGPDQFLAVVADVYTNLDQALEEGVGYADQIYVAVEIGGNLYLMRGAVFSYYEFKQPSSNRLTDEQWQQMLKTGKAPERPGWAEKFMHFQRVGKPVDPYLYSSGC